MTGFDLSRIHKNGSHYAIIGFSAPIFLDLPKDTYEVCVYMEGKNISGHEVIVQVILDKGDAGKMPVLPTPVIGSMPSMGEDARRINFTTFTVCIPFRINDPNKNLDYELVWRKLRDLENEFERTAVSAVNHLILTYRHLTGEISTKPLSRKDALYKFSLALLFDKNVSNDESDRYQAVGTTKYSNECMFRSETSVPASVSDEL